MGQLVEEVTSRKDPGEHMEGFPGCGMKGAGNEADAFIENELGLGTKGTVFAGCGPELATVRQDGKANGVEDEAPVGHGEATVRVA